MIMVKIYIKNGGKFCGYFIKEGVFYVIIFLFQYSWVCIYKEGIYLG